MPLIRFFRNSWLAPFLLCASCAPKTPINRFTDIDGPSRLRAEITAHREGEIASVHRLWLEYLNSIKGEFGCSPSKHWLDEEQAPFTTSFGMLIPRCADLVTTALWPAVQPYEVLSIARNSGTGDVRYRITTRFIDSTGVRSGSNARITLTTVFALRTQGEWKLSGSIVQLTRDWHREVVGPFTYIVSPALRFSRRRAEDAARFADSLSKAFGVPPLTPMNYYLVRDGDEMLRLKGLELDTIYGTPGGQSLVGAIISGDTVFGENHGHEIVHNVLLPVSGPNLNIVASEGLPTWLGGTRSLRYPAALGVLRAYLNKNSQIDLDQIIASNTHPVFNHSSALLAQMVHEKRGNEGIRQFMNSGPSLAEFKTGMERILGMRWTDVAADWKRRALAAGSPVP